jgi:hypothetical protein
MVNVEIRTLHEPDGTPVCNVAFDLSAQQLTASEHASGEMLLERHRGASLDVDGVLALRELTGVRDELDRLADAGGHARLTLPLARFIALHDALDEYVNTRTGRDWAREADAEALPVLGAMLGHMAALRADALTAVLGEHHAPHEQ